MVAKQKEAKQKGKVKEQSLMHQLKEIKKEILKEQRKIENKIAKIISDFYKKTGAEIEYIDILPDDSDEYTTSINVVFKYDSAYDDEQDDEDEFDEGDDLGHSLKRKKKKPTEE